MYKFANFKKSMNFSLTPDPNLKYAWLPPCGISYLLFLSSVFPREENVSPGPHLKVGNGGWVDDRSSSLFGSLGMSRKRKDPKRRR